jgi:hypothetical protein
MSKKKNSSDEVRLIIAGSRTIKDYKVVKKAIAKGLKELKLSVSDIVEVVSGHAGGVDRLGEQWGHENEIEVKIFEAEWDNVDRAGAKIATNKWGKEYDKMAGLHRNTIMADHGTHLIAINEGTNGTDHMVKTMKELNKPYFEEKIGESDEKYDYSF